MSTRATSDEGRVHPYRAAWSTRDLHPWIDALSPDVEMWSPMLRRPFKGREAAAEIFAILFAAFGDFRIGHELDGRDVTAFFWSGDLRGRIIEGADLITTDEAGRIREIRVLIRPLIDIATFAAAIGPPLARRRGRIRGAIASILALPLRPLLIAVDLMATRLSSTW